ncbi:MAG: RusA family crossover junction endodeoxyribonuclease [Alphaproteobacteria bacterium]|nr:RusA family crossover junction endodeoxyribonuclease [Alphaproteobacteria bacterium]
MAPWKATILEAARRQWPVGEEPIGVECSISIVHFYAGAAMDVDNFAKPLLDAIKGLVLLDDHLVSQLTVRRTDLAALLPMSGYPRDVQPYIRAGSDFVYLRVDRAPNHEVLP